MKRTITQLSSVLCPSRAICAAIVLATIMATSTGCGPGDPIHEVREQMAAGEFVRSLELLRELIDAEPDNPELLFLYGRALVKTGQLAPASWPLRKAMQDPNWFERSATVVADIEVVGGNLENAAEIYAEILEKNPDNMAARIQRANICARSPRLTEEALAEVDRILEISPDEIGAYKPRILAYLSLNKPEEAEQAMDDLAVKMDEQHYNNEASRGWLCATKAIFAAESGDEALAHERWAVCEKEFPAHSSVVAQSVEFHRDRGELERALEVAEAAFDADPSITSGYRIVVADLLRRVDRPDDAEKILLDGVVGQESLNKAAALLALTEHYKAVGDLEAAVESLERGLVLTQESTGPQPDLLFALADLLIQIGDTERALELTRPMTVAAHRSLVRGRVAHERKHYAKAIELYEETTRLWPENPYAPYHAGRAAMSAARFDLAFESFLLSVRVDDAATDARCRAAQLLDAEGKPRPAMEMLAGSRVGMNPACGVLLVEILARTQGPSAASTSAGRMSQQHPTYYGRAIAAAAKGARARGGGDIGDAWGIIGPLLALDLTTINALPVLQAAVESAPGDAELAAVRPLVQAAIESDPNSAFLQTVEGMLFERLGALDPARASYRRALEVEPNRVPTLLRLARISVASEPQGAIELIERALAEQETSSQPLDPELFLAAIAELPESSGVESLLQSALDFVPTSGAVALRLGTMLEVSGAEAKRVVGLANRAIRFQQGQEAADLRERARARL